MATKMTIKRKPVIKKYFRLFDFNVYDEIQESDDSDSGSDNGQKKYQKDNKIFVIQMFGVNEKGETCSIYVKDFQPFFFILVGNEWSHRERTELTKDIQSKLAKKYVDSIVKSELVEYNKLYGFSAGNKDKFVKLTFKNVDTMNRVKNLWYIYTENQERKKVGYKFLGLSLDLYESGNIPPLLRFFHINEISPSGWVSFVTSRVMKPPMQTTTCTYEYICPLEELKSEPTKLDRVPFKICSFDIEASSSHGDFPVPIKTYKRLSSQIVDTFQKQSAFISDIGRATQFLQKSIMTAFGYDHFEGIDLVYPKKCPTKERVKALIQILSKESLEDAKKAGTEDNNKLLTIDSMFETMNEKQQQAGIELDSSENVAMTDDVDLTNDSDDDEGDAKIPEKYVAAKKAKCPDTILDILLNKELKRDEKIQITNDVLTRIFPRLEGDKVTFIGSTFLRYGDLNPYMSHCLALGTCDEVEGVIIDAVDDEKTLLLRWSELIQKENPDIIIGYNIFGFDYEFLFRRAEENECVHDFMTLSRKIGELAAKPKRDNPSELTIESTKLAIASGEYDLRYFKMTGRLQIDLYAAFRRDFIMSSYKLDDVAGQFISDDIKRVELIDHDIFGPVTELYSQNLMGIHTNDFIHIELSGYTTDYHKQGHKFKILEIQKDKEVVEMVKGEEKTVKYNVLTIGGHETFEKGKTIKWTMAKDDVSPKDIFRLANGSSSERAIVAKYCIQDCNLVHHLMNKIDIITGHSEMANICSVPISFLVFRGQGIKLTSFVAKKCRENQMLMPDLEKSHDYDKYEGAIVLPPKCAMYIDNPVACVDYSSLYPSSMISQNFSHDSLVWSKEYDLDSKLIKERGERDHKGNYKYDNLPGYHYIDITYDNFKYLRAGGATSRSVAKKTKVGHIVCRWAQLPDGKKSILPSILEELLKARSATRKLIKTEKDPFMQNILDKRQLAYKVTANSLYGQCGSRTSSFYEKNVAASTTATGRMMIIYARRIIEEVYGDRIYNTALQGPVRTKAEYVYGDSVASYTPVHMRAKIMNGGTIETSCNQTFICDLARRFGKDQWTKCTEEGKQEKEFCEFDGIETWTEKGWTKVHRVIRHKLARHKKMVRIVTDNGIVDVTDDHSLLLSNAKEISPTDCKKGTELLHHKLTNDDGIQDTELIDALKNNSKLNVLKPIDPKNNYFEYKIDCDKYPGMLYLEIIRKLGLGEIHKNQHIIIRQDASGDKQLLTEIVYTACLQYEIELKTGFSKYTNEYVLTYDPNDTKFNNQIKSITEIKYDGYVYDLTTENHHFAAGIGSLIVHNTDSVFFTFNLENAETGEKIVGKPALEMTIEIAQDAAALCSQWLKPPMDLAYEKTLMPFILLSKKRYVGMLYEENPNKGKLKYMGLPLKRRDSCDYMKDVYGGVLDILMKSTDIKLATTHLQDRLQELIHGKVPMEKLAITKALRSDYKNPESIGHNVLAERIGKRDPGNKPKSGDRIKFVFVVNDNKKALQGDKMETPEFIVENSLPIDYNHYITNQLMKPLLQLFGLEVEKIWKAQGRWSAIKEYKKTIQKLEQEFPDLEIFMKKKEKVCAAKVKELLFDKVLEKIHNDKNGIQQITNWFKKGNP
jgi:DNA polymerase elongation subunit (family B)